MSYGSRRVMRAKRAPGICCPPVRLARKAGARRIFARVRLPLAAAALILLIRTPAAAQSIPRTADGKPDLSGIWQTLNSATWNVEDHTASPGVPAGQGVVDGGTIPYLPA